MKYIIARDIFMEIRSIIGKRGISNNTTAKVILASHFGLAPHEIAVDDITIPTLANAHLPVTIRWHIQS